VINSGFACYLEKPPTLDHREFEEMMQIEEKARHDSFIGFSHIFRPEYGGLKERIRSGEFGALTEVNFLGLWPRSMAYFRRSASAGRLHYGERRILDSCLGNAMAHHVHASLFWAGRGTMWSWAEPESVRARLFRANPIEAPDTVFLESNLPGGIRMRMAASHACSQSIAYQEIICERARIHISYAIPSAILIQMESGKNETIPLVPKDAYVENHRWYIEYLRGLRKRPCTRLGDCRAMVQLNNLAYVSANVIDTVRADCRRGFLCNGSDGIMIPGIESMGREFIRTGATPGIGKTDRGTAPGRPVGLSELDGVAQVVSRMVECAPGFRTPSPA
jgi:predicted dehydrogenase